MTIAERRRRKFFQAKVSETVKIKTHYDFPPIPDRSMDWSAIDDSTYEPGGTVGRGATEAEAIQDLLEQKEGE